MTGLDDTARPPAPCISVKVILFADLRRFLRPGADGPQLYTLPPGARLSDLLAAVGLAVDTDVTAAVNGELAAKDTELRDGAEVMLLSPMEGGAVAAREAAIQERR